MGVLDQAARGQYASHRGDFVRNQQSQLAFSIEITGTELEHSGTLHKFIDHHAELQQIVDEARRNND